MNLENKKIILTGATGGLGNEILKILISKKANLIITASNQDRLNELIKTIDVKTGQWIEAINCDLSSSTACDEFIKQTLAKHQHVDMLINMAGVQSFNELEYLTQEDIKQHIDINITAPIILSKGLLPSMKKNNKGAIVNIGSTFGSIGFAYFSVYSATKFALKGFSEALNRELQDTDIDVIYIAPRGIKTKMNSDRFYEMGEKVGINFDDPKIVADSIVSAIEKKKKRTYIGFPECLFVRINALFPSIVDKALKKQNRIAKDYV